MLQQMMSVVLAAFLAPAAPSDGSWQVGSAPDGECYLGGELVANGRILRLSKSLGSDEFGISIEDTKAKVRNRKYENVKLTLDNGWSGEGFGASGSTDDPGTSFLYISVIDPDFIGKLGSARSFTISHPKMTTIRIALGARNFPVLQMEECENVRLRKIGIDPIAWRTRPKPVPLVPIGKLVSGDDYTPTMIYRHLGGTVPVMLTVNTKGRVQACEPLEAAVDQELKATTCRVLARKARFKPAVDESGNAVVGKYFYAITWHIA
jgi:hypothetical protein